MLLFPILKMIQFVLHDVHFWLRYAHFYKVVSLQQFCPHHSEKHKSQILILGIAPLGLHHSYNPPRHTLNQILAYHCINLVPLPLHPLPKLIIPSGSLSYSCSLVLQIFNEIKPRQLHAIPNFYPIMLELVYDLFRPALWLLSCQNIQK